ncbi:hypothetical protein SLS64_011797 [Diaporthe eres]|uniref:Uncharacterized protein n=1 Tax=Diaporthe eres TaxID=83184 RepID=A0ABR1P430_DIAER
MADPLNEDYYNVSATSDSDDSGPDNSEDITNITAGIDLAAIRTQLQNQARGPNFPNFFQTGLQGTFNKHPAVRPDDVFEDQETEEWVFPSEYAT